MHLSDHDLRQLDGERLETLTLEPLRALSEKLLLDLKAARERLNQTPENSSRPRAAKHRGNASRPRRGRRTRRPAGWRMAKTPLREEQSTRRPTSPRRPPSSPTRSGLARLAQAGLDAVLAPEA